MEPLTTAAIAVGTIIATKASLRFGERFGERFFSSRKQQDLTMYA